MNTTWFITGTSSGLGRSMTTKLLARGDRVAATLRKPQALDDLKNQYGDRLWVAALDVTDTAAIRAVVDRAFAELGRIDVLVSNAGYAIFGAAEELTDAQIDHQIATNLTGSIQLIRAALPHLRQQGGGRIMQLSSEGGQVAYPVFSLYHATKWGIEGFVESVAQEVAGFGIGITLVEPGATATKFGENLVQPKPMDVYENSRVGEARRTVLQGDLKDFGAISDAAKVAQAIIDSADGEGAPLRLALGSSTFAHLRDGWTARLKALEAQQAVAESTDMDG